MTEELYAKLIRHALESVYVAAARRGLDIGQLTAEIDSGRIPGIYEEHTLTISVRGTSIAVTAEAIPHEWLDIGTGFIDSRLSRRISFLLADLEKKWAL